MPVLLLCFTYVYIHIYAVVIKIKKLSIQYLKYGQPHIPDHRTFTLLLPYFHHTFTVFLPYYK